MLRRSWVWMGWAALLGGLQGVSAQTVYRLIDLGPGVANDINNAGIVVGTDAASGGWRYDGTVRESVRFRTTRIPVGAGNAPAQTLPVVEVTRINDAGSLVGWVRLSSGELAPFFKPPAGDAVSPPLTSATTLALGPTDQWAYGSQVFEGALGSGTHVDLPFSVTAINAVGNLVGVGANPEDPNPSDACVSPAQRIAGIVSALDTTFGVFPCHGGAVDINALDQVLTVATNNLPPFGVPYVSSRLHDGPVFREIAMFAARVNDRGVVVGSEDVGSNGYNEGAETVAMIDVDGMLMDLNDWVAVGGGTEWILIRAMAINHAGEIVGYGTRSGVQHAFLLRPAVVSVPPSIRMQPASTGIYAGSTLFLPAAAQGVHPLTYQWQKDGIDIPNATGSALRLEKVDLTGSGRYRVLVTNPAGTTASNEAEVLVLPAPVLSVRRDASGVHLSVRGARGFHQVQSTEDVVHGSWRYRATLYPGDWINGITASWDEPDGALTPARYYRVIGE